MYKQNDIILISFPYTDLTTAKLRPALILSNNKLPTDKICCLITSKKTQDCITIPDNALAKGNLPLQSWIKPHRLFTINERIIKKKLCMTTPAFQKKIITAVNEYFAQ